MRSLQSSRTVLLMAALFLLAPCRLRAASEPAESSASRGPLSVDQVVQNLVQRNLQRANSLRHFDAIRVYHLAYHGFLGEREAEMTVEARYDSPSTKNFKITSQRGSKIIQDRVFKKLLEGEQEAARPAVSERVTLNRENYDFALVGYEPSPEGGQYILQVTPKTKNKYSYRGKVWVDGTDFAVTRFEGEPAQNPSFWTKRSEIRHQYQKVQGFWLPAHNESVSYTRLGGRAILTIEYKYNSVVAARNNSRVTTALPPDGIGELAPTM